MCERNKTVKAARKWTLKRRNSDPWTFIHEGDQVKDMTEAHYLIQEVIMKEEKKAHPLDSDTLFEKLHKCHTENMDDIPDIPLSEMERLNEEMFAMLDETELEDIMAMEEYDEDIFRPMYEVDIDEKYERMSSKSNFTFAQNCRSAEDINLRNCVLLNIESTVHAFCNRNLVERVWTLDDSMTLITNG